MVRLNTTPQDRRASATLQSDVVARIRAAVGETLRATGAGRWVLAVSGGGDSMVLLDAAVAELGPRSVVVATFDHGTGEWATEAAQMVAAHARSLGVSSEVGRADDHPPSKRGDGDEAAWRAQRWAFLTQAAKRYGAAIVTAHTRDDQVETVFIRALRDAGPRGLAALYADSAVVRPLLPFTRSEILEYARLAGVTFVTDPSNTNRRYLRNRVRHDLLPALVQARPSFAEDLLTIAKESAVWRARIEQIAATFTVMIDGTGAYHVSREQLEGYSADALGALWPALAARAGVVMDWRGTQRLSTFTIEGVTGQSIQLSGGVEVIMRRDAMVFRRWRRDVERGAGHNAECNA